jgi:hypothetical protein
VFLFLFLLSSLYNGSNGLCQPNTTCLINGSDGLCCVNQLFKWAVLGSKGLTFLAKWVDPNTTREHVFSALAASTHGIIKHG